MGCFNSKEGIAGAPKTTHAREAHYSAKEAGPTPVSSYVSGSKSGKGVVDVDDVDVHEKRASRSSSASRALDKEALDRHNAANVDGFRTFDGLSGTNSDEESDWDRLSSSEFSSPDAAEVEAGSQVGEFDGPSGSDPHDLTRKRERSLFGVAEKKSRSALRETASLKLAKLRGCTFVNQYVVIKYLGRGACGRVFLCMDMNDQRLYAVKMVKKGELEAGRKAGYKRKRNPIEDLRREVAIMRKLRHKNIVVLQEVVDDPHGNKMLLVMDYMEGGPVMTREALDRGRCIPEPLALQYFRDMCKALDYLHHNKVVHGDLKPENVLMSARGNVTLSDFGCSKVINDGNEYLERCNGTPAFLAPEMMKPHTRYRGRPTDVYALGACLYTFVFGRIPFNAPNVFKLFQIVQTEPVRFPEEPKVSDELRDLIIRMLTKDPKQRITMSRVMRHPWVTRHGSWRLKTIREMLRDGDGPELNELPDLMATANVLDVPRQDHILEVVRPGLPVRVYEDGEFLLRQGEQGLFMLYIMEGQCEVLLKLPQSRDSGGRSSRGSNSGDGESVRSSRIQSQEAIIGHDLPPALLEGASKANEFTQMLARGKREFLVALRSEGQFIGEMSLFATAALRCASVRAKGRVKVLVIPGEHVHDAINTMPEARQQVLEMVWMKQSENMVLEAMTRLSSVHDTLEELLTGELQP